MNSDHKNYLHFSKKSRLLKSIESVVGIITGIDIDKDINPTELKYLHDWLTTHDEVKFSHPFNELIPVITAAVRDKRLDDSEKQDILWLCNKFTAGSYLDDTSAELPKLHGILAGIASDGKVLEKELKGLRRWISGHSELKTCYPYDEIDSLIIQVMQDKVIDRDEHTMLMNWFTEFSNFDGEQAITNAPIKIGKTITGLFAIDPEIIFSDHLFCITGASSKHTRAELVNMIKRRHGLFSNYMSSKVNYLVVCAEGNPCWQYACYGRKVEKAIELRKNGSRIMLIHENDFHDAVADY